MSDVTAGQSDADYGVEIPPRVHPGAGTWVWAANGPTAAPVVFVPFGDPADAADTPHVVEAPQ